jgi:hypothetical protein
LFDRDLHAAQHTTCAENCWTKLNYFPMPVQLLKS